MICYKNLEMGEPMIWGAFVCEKVSRFVEILSLYRYLLLESLSLFRDKSRDKSFFFLGIESYFRYITFAFFVFENLFWLYLFDLSLSDFIPSITISDEFSVNWIRIYYIQYREYQKHICELKESTAKDLKQL